MASRNELAVVVVGAALVAAVWSAVSGGRSTPRVQAHGRAARSSSPRLAGRAPLGPGSRVVFAITPATWGEGEVTRVAGDRVTVAHEWSGTREQTTLERYRTVATSSAASHPHEGEYLLARIGPARWQSCRVGQVTGPRVRCTDPTGHSLELEPAALLRPDARLQAEMASYLDLHAHYREFDDALRRAGRPVAPAGWTPAVGDRVVARQDGTHWYDGRIIRLDGTRARLDWSAPTGDQTASSYDMAPLPVGPQRAEVGQFCLVRPSHAAVRWEPHRIVSAAESSFEVEDRDGKRTSVAATDILPLASEGGPARPPDAAFDVSPPEVVDAMLELAEVTRDDVVYDLGCGDGSILVAAALHYGAHAVGYDIDPGRVAESRDNARRHGVEQLVRVEVADIFTVDLSGATVVTLYLGEQINRRLLPQLRRLAPGTRVVSHAFTIPGVAPERSIAVVSAGRQRAWPADGPHDSGAGVPIHLWRAPLRLPPAPAP